MSDVLIKNVDNLTHTEFKKMSNVLTKNDGNLPHVPNGILGKQSIKTPLCWREIQRFPQKKVGERKLRDIYACIQTEDVRTPRKSDADLGITPHNILEQLIADCKQQCASNNDIKNALDVLNKEIDKFSYAGAWRDFSTAPWEIASYFLDPFGLLSAAYDGCCRMREAAIREPLFSAIENLIEKKLASLPEQSLDTKTKLSYIALLSSISRKDTKKFLSTDLGKKLILTSDVEAFPTVFPTDEEMTSYEKFVRNLFMVLHPTCEPENEQENKELENIKEIEKKLNNDYDIERTRHLCQMIHRNLMHGQKFNGFDEGYETLSIDDSPYKLYHLEIRLLQLACSTQGAFLLDQDKKHRQQGYTNPNEEFLTNEELKNSGLNDLKYDKEHYTNNNETLNIATKKMPKLLLLEAKMLGLIPLEKAEELEKKGVLEIEPMCICFRNPPKLTSLNNVKDYVPGIQNALDLTPKYIEEADKFVQAVIKKIDTQNNEKGSIPLVPIFTGFCQGGIFAYSVAAKNGYSSVSFNSSGPGRGLQKFIGSNKRGEYHQSFFMKDDWLADKNSFRYKPQFGQPYIIDNLSNNIKRKGAMERHASYRSACDEWYHNSTESRKSNNIR